MGNIHWRNNILLLIASLIWGAALVAQSVSTQYIGPFTYVTIRSVLGGAFLLLCIFLLHKRKKGSVAAIWQNAASRRRLLIAGSLCGVVLCVSTLFQQFGISYTSVGKTGFITALYIVFVPLASLFLGKKPGKFLFLGVVIAVIGIYFLCIDESITINKGDVLVFICALCYTGHIMLIDYFSPQIDCIQMSCLQLFVCAALSCIPMFIWEQPELSRILDAAWPLLYSGVMSCGIAYTLQILGQKNNDPTISSLLLSLEAVFAAIAGWLLLQQTMNSQEILGCVLMFTAIILAQIPAGKSWVQLEKRL